MQSNRFDSIRPIRWTDSGLELLDQRRLPHRVETLVLTQVQEVARAITDMVVRGAPAIGITAAYGVAMAARERYGSSPGSWKQAIEPDLSLLLAARPTAVNLAWAVESMRPLIFAIEEDPFETLLARAREIHDQDILANYRMGELGAGLIQPDSSVLTHCNAGALATGGYGTALGVVRTGFAQGNICAVYADETRPWLQGARLTAWELLQDEIPVSLIADSAASYAMSQGKVDWVIVGADRVAANGDVANKIGTYGLAITARHHGVGFMVVAPTTSIDMDARDGNAIPIENRTETELLELGAVPVAAPGALAWNPVFDVTPAALVDALVTERGVVLRPDSGSIRELLQRPDSDLPR